MTPLSSSPIGSTVEPIVVPIVIPIVALDVPDRLAAQAVVSSLGDACGFYKVGLELFAAEGPEIVSWLRDAGKLAFVDLKLHDIPNTVRGAARTVARYGASLLTVHASGGSAMVRAAVEGAQEGTEAAAGSAPSGGCGILGVTILTSMDAAAIGDAWGRDRVDVTSEVVRLAELVRVGGGAGIVCSGHEAAAVRTAFGDGLGLLVPGIRLPGGDSHDQRRVMTPRAAADAGARWLILGRAVTGAADPVAAMATVVASLAGAP
jgi:orotidine-5'-phosphate decarboxylase